MFFTDLMNLSMISVLPPSFFGVVFFKSLPVPLRILVGLVLCTLMIEVIAYLLFLNNSSNMHLIQAYSYIEFIAISIIYLMIIKDTRSKLILKLIFALFGILLILAHFIPSLNEYLTLVTRFVQPCVLIIYFVLYLSSTMINDESLFIEFSPYFLLTVGFLLYFTGMIITLLFFGLMELKGAYKPWNIHGVLNIMLNVFFTIVIWKGSKVSKA